MHADGLTLRVLAAAKRLPVEFLRGVGVSDGRWQGHPAVRIGYRDARDREVTHQYRIALTGDRFRFPSGAKPIPYGIWRLATTNTPAWVFLVEGPSDCWTLWSHDIPAIGLPSASIWREEWTSYFEGVALIYAVDEGDQGGHTLLTALAGSALRDRVRVVRFDGAKDPSDLYLADPDSFVDRMAAARDAALRLEVTQTDPAPPAIATLDATLTAVEQLICRFVHFSDPAQSVAITLWVAVTYLWSQFETLIYLVVTSAVKQSGKTRTFDVLEWLTASAWRAVRPSEAVTFRRLDRDHPTLLLDEYDTVFGDRGGQFEGIRAIYNSGNRRGTKVSRAVAKGRGFDLVDFDIYSPKALAGIGPLPDTVTDRAIVIHLSRRARGEPIERLRTRAFRALAAPIQEALTYHLARVDLAGAEPEIPDQLGDRAADGWEPLLAIADQAGGAWPSRARQAAIALSAAGVVDDESWGITLLADVRVVFGERGLDHLWTAPLIEALVAIEESPWADIRGKPVSATHVAKLLRPFGIGPKLVRHGGDVKRGYVAADFEDAWARYLPAPDPSDARYTRYARYADGESSRRERGPTGPPVTPVTAVTGPSGARGGEPGTCEDPTRRADEQMRWTE